MRSLVTALSWAIAATATTSPPLVGQSGAETETVRLIRGRIEVLRSGSIAYASGSRLLATVALPEFFEGRAFHPAWLADPEPHDLGALIASVERATEHGLDPADYHLAELVELTATIRSGRATPTDSVDLELLASDAFMVLGSHLLHGRINAETVDPEWIANRRSARFHEVLARALESGAVEETLFDLAPSQPRYRAMVRGLDRLRAIVAQGGWTPVPEGPKLEVGSLGPRVRALQARLTESGDLEAVRGAQSGTLEAARFDEPTKAAVQRFQARHGLEADGVVGPATLAALNTPADERAAQIATNLERWRWLPADLGRRHIEVNVAAFEAHVVEEGRTVRTHRVVVGRQYRQTPMFTGSMTYLVFSPYWHVPPTIAAVDKFPVLQRDLSSLAAQRLTLLEQGSNRPVDPATVEWNALTGREFNRLYRLRQDPGPHNALGSVKFMFPNRHNVYLHDTPSRELFGRTVRNFSSGCIRVEAPLDLAEYLLSSEPGWDRSRIDVAASAGSEQVVRLGSPVPVHLLYWTAWADADGMLHFRDDIYRRDAAVRVALEADPPGP